LTCPVSEAGGRMASRKDMSRTLVVGVAVLAATLLSSSAFAQGSIAGTVKDPSGHELPGVEVVLSAPPRTTVTNGNGGYRFSALAPGKYTLTFTLPGFITVIRDDVAIVSSFEATVNIELKLRPVDETIRVTGPSPIQDPNTPFVLPLVGIQATARQQVLNLTVIAAIPTDNGSQHLLAATYSLDERQVITGQLIDISRRQPWAFVHINVTNADGDTERWVVEWIRPFPLLRGQGADSGLRPGDHVVAIGSPIRNRDVHRLLLRKISRSDGWSWEGNPLGLDVLVPGGLLPNSR
jgi:hypothetical protein